MATWVAVKIVGSGEVSYVNADQVAYVMTSDQTDTCQVNFAGAKDSYVVVEGSADRILNSMGGPAFDVTGAPRAPGCRHAHRLISPWLCCASSRLNPSGTPEVYPARATSR